MAYCGKPLPLVMEKDQDNTLQIGHVLLTQAGRELTQIINSPGVEGFYDYVKEKWKAYAPKDENT